MSPFDLLCVLALTTAMVWAAAKSIEGTKTRQVDIHTFENLRWLAGWMTVIFLCSTVLITFT